MTEQNSDQSIKSHSDSLLGALARMVIGGLSLGMDLLSSGLDVYDNPPVQIETEEQTPMDAEPPEDIFYTRLPEGTPHSGRMITPQKSKKPSTDLTYILTGVLADTSQRVGRFSRSLNRTSARASRTVAPLISPFTHNILTKPFWKRFDKLVHRGEDQVSRWKQLGQSEASQGKELIQTITFTTVDSSIDYVAQQPEVVDLVTTKTRSAVSVLIEYFRSNFISMDLLLHGLFHRLSRVPGRRRWASPPIEVREGATFKIFQAQDIKVSLEDTHIGYYSGVISRITAFIIDLFIVGIAFNITGWFIKTSANLLGINLEEFLSLHLRFSQLLAGSIMAFIFFALYNTLFWSLFGETLGQALLGLRVLTMKGELPGFFRSFLRATVGFSLSISLFFISLIMILLDVRHLALHDRIFRTVVVYTWDAHPSQRFMDRALAKYGDEL